MKSSKLKGGWEQLAHKNKQKYGSIFSILILTTFSPNSFPTRLKIFKRFEIRSTNFPANNFEKSSANTTRKMQ